MITYLLLSAFSFVDIGLHLTTTFTVSALLLMNINYILNLVIYNFINNLLFFSFFYGCNFLLNFTILNFYKTKNSIINF